MMDSTHWAPEATIYPRGSRIMSRDLVTVMQAQERRWARLERALWTIRRWFRHGASALGVAGLLTGCASTNPRVIVARHAPPITQQCTSDAPELNCPAPWWRKLNGVAHVYYLPGKPEVK
ncbi:MAG TPA: hypothetical protein VJQ82_13915 [Terriglobales bacterium]|nr:hypothetical protein [Terriglobales bacterium]